MKSLTAQRVANVYDCLRGFPPFNRWKLPHSDAVEFRLTARTDRHGDFSTTAYNPLDKPRIMLSYVKHTHFDSVVKTVAHEMVHLAQAIARTDTATEHNADFMERAKQVCKNFGFDLGQF
jgi:hypothetical protein